MRGPGEILLLSTYELGHAPHGIAVPMAFLERAGFRPAALDLAVEKLDAARAGRARLALVSIPMHTATRLGLEAAARLRALAPGIAIAFHGLYAALHADLLLREGAAAVVGPDQEDALVALAEALERGEPPPARRPAPGARPHRLELPVPSRGALPPPDRYARLLAADGDRLAGYTEATRGCKHRCRHCPLPPFHDGHFTAVPAGVVLADVAQQIAAGVRHVTFGDPDFLNGPGHALRIARELHARWPGVTFDFTAKVEHLVARPGDVAELARLGALFVTSAVESFSDEVLVRLAKGHDRADALAAFRVCEDAGLALRPTFVPFTPWETLASYLELLETLERHGWLSHVDPVQLSLRLLVPPGSLLEGDPTIPFDALDDAALGWRWHHPDPRMDALQARIAAEVHAGEAAHAPQREILDRVHALAAAAAGAPHRHVKVLSPGARQVPRLTESWFC
ncbi:MAG: CUAEP/CCAEP-tail radical SAM protein [Anaeromyxobacter sp.]